MPLRLAPTGVGTGAQTFAAGNDNRFSAPTITGGTINGAPVGATTPAAGAFTTLSASSETITGTTAAYGSNTGGSWTTFFNGAAGTFRGFTFQTAGVKRFDFQISGDAETGGNGGSVFFLNTFSDTGSFTGQAFQVSRANGAMTIQTAIIPAGTINGATVGATTPSTGAFTTLSATTPVAIASGGTGAATAAAARVAFGLVAASVSVQWTGGAVVANGTYWFTVSAPYAGTVNSLDYLTGAGSFTANVQIAGASVTGLAAVAVNSATVANAAATAANTFAAGQPITVVITAAASSPTNAILNLRLTRA